MVARKIQKSAAAAVENWILIFGINLKMVARKIQSSKFDRSRGRILNFECWYKFKNGFSPN